MADCPGTDELSGSPREALKKLVGQTVRVTAVFKREGLKECKNGKVRIKKTVLITNIRDVESGDILAGHMWFNRGNTWEKLDLHRGDLVEFAARSIEYRKGYWGRGALWRRLDPPKTDYRLTPPKDIRVALRSHLGNGKKRRETVAVPACALAVV